VRRGIVTAWDGAAGGWRVAVARAERASGNEVGAAREQRAPLSDRTRSPFGCHALSFAALSRTSSIVPCRKNACSGSVSALPSRISLKDATVSLIET